MLVVACRTYLPVVLALMTAIVAGCDGPDERDGVGPAGETEGEQQEVGSLTLRPRLLLCQADSGESREALIGSEGGTLRLGDHVLEIPSDAVAAPTRFTIEVPGGTRYAEIELTATDQDGNEVPEFDAPLVLTISYNRGCNVDPGETEQGAARRRYYGIYRISRDHTQFLEALGGGDHKRQQRVSSFVNHLSRYAVATN